MCNHESERTTVITRLGGGGMRGYGRDFQPRHRAGFTLVELIMILSIVGLLTSIAVPRVDFVRFQVAGAVREVQSSVTAARGQALLRQHDVVVTFDVSDDRLYVLTDANNNGVTDTGEMRRMIQLSENVKFDRGGAAALNGVTDALSFTKESESLPALSFHRNGAATEEGTFYLTSLRAAGGTDYPQDTRALTVVRSTGNVHCYSYRTLTWLEGC